MSEREERERAWRRIATLGMVAAVVGGVGIVYWDVMPGRPPHTRLLLPDGYSGRVVVEEHPEGQALSRLAHEVRVKVSESGVALVRDIERVTERRGLFWSKPRAIWGLEQRGAVIPMCKDGSTPCWIDTSFGPTKIQIEIRR